MDTRALSEGSPVNRFRSAAAAVLLAALVPRPLAGQTPSVDTSNASVLIDQGLTHSQVMPNLQYLSDVIGPRLTGSSAARAANDWTMARFKQYGLEAHLEPWNFGGTWTRGPILVRVPAPPGPPGPGAGRGGGAGPTRQAGGGAGGGRAGA